MEQVILLGFPFFAAMMLAEWLFSERLGRQTYRLNDTLASLSQGLLSQTTLLFTGLCQFGMYALLYRHLAVAPEAPFWHTPAGWVAAVLLVDLCAYWAHRSGHEVAILWAAHIVHHQSQYFNLSTAFRQETAYPLLAWIFFAPLAILGMPPQVYGTAWIVVLFYQIWIHTELVGKLGWLEWVFSTPSNHRVHHAVNDRYLDRNYGAMFIIWDRLFGTYQAEEAEPCVYGTRPLLNTWNPIRANTLVYADLWRDCLETRHWIDKCRVWLKHPGWQPADLAARRPNPVFEISQVAVYNPPLSRSVQLTAIASFVLAAVLAAVYLWRAPQGSTALALGQLLPLAGVLWATGALMQGRMHQRSALGMSIGLCVLSLAGYSAL